MKTLILAAAAALISAPAFANVDGAIAHFNAAKDNGEQVVLVGGEGPVVSTRSGNSSVQARFNADFDTQDNARKTGPVTVADGSQDTASAIFLRIQAEGAENE